jgi:7-cyano-7-deazaguanine synthase
MFSSISLSLNGCASCGREEKRKANYAFLHLCNKKALKNARFVLLIPRSSLRSRQTNFRRGSKLTKVLVVLSGGQDSTTCLFWAKKNFYEIHAVTFDYAQRHRREIEAAKKVAELAGVASHEVIEVGPLLRGRSPLTNKDAALETYTDYASMDQIIGDRVELTFVPMRNAFFLTLAANIALSKDIYWLVTGVCEADNANYPDCRASFIAAQESTINEALGIAGFRIHTPLMNLSKAESIALAQTLPGCMEALAYSHTAYDGNYPPVGKDHASTLRAHGFEEAGVPDPLVARAWREGLMELPASANYASLRAAA